VVKDKKFATQSMDVNAKLARLRPELGRKDYDSSASQHSQRHLRRTAFRKRKSISTKDARGGAISEPACREAGGWWNAYAIASASAQR